MNKKIYLSALTTFLLLSVVSAGIGVKYDEGVQSIQAGKESCIMLGAYNPFSESQAINIELIGELNSILSSGTQRQVTIPAETSSQNAIPVEFCFKPGKSVCNGGKKIYNGEVILTSATPSGGVQGPTSLTAMAVSAPLNLEVLCSKNNNPLTLLIIVSILALAGFLFFNKRGK